MAYICAGMITKRSMADLNRLNKDEFKSSDKTPVAIVLDNVRSALNVGSVFRTADAFRIKEILLLGITATPPNRDIQKTALGATDTIKWTYMHNIDEAISYLKTEKYQLIGIEQVNGSIALQNFHTEFSKPLALFFGNEVSGLSENLLPHLDFCIEIPQIGMKHSLNIAVSAGILCWDLFTKFYYHSKEI